MLAWLPPHAWQRHDPRTYATKANLYAHLQSNDNEKSINDVAQEITTGKNQNETTRIIR